jgi:arylsulfatase A-like enzyme
MNRPNVVLFLTDQQRWDTLRAGGTPHVHTPNLDRLAAQGTLFDHAFCNCPVCMPSRHSLLSGRYPSAIGRCCNGIEMDPAIPCLHNLLRPVGYHTANIGKLHFKNHSNRDHREPHPTYGFDTLILSDEPGCYDDAYIKWVAEQDPSQVDRCRCSTPPAWTGKPVVKQPRGTHQPYLFEGPDHLTHTAFVGRETAHYVRTRAGAGPFFAIAGFYAPHCPLNPPRRFVDLYDPSDLPPPAMNEDENRHGLSDAEWRKVKAYYYAMISQIDEEVGRVLSALDDARVRDNTLILFTSDHGEHLGDHGLVHKGPPGYDSCARVPLIVTTPGPGAEGETRSELIELVDLAPTVLDYCGVQVPPFLQGRSLRSLLEDRPYEPRSSVFLEHREPFGISWKTVRTHEWKYAVSSKGDELLFDLGKDPNELVNVATERDRRGELHALRDELLRRWFDVENQYPRRTGRY